MNAKLIEAASEIVSRLLAEITVQQQNSKDVNLFSNYQTGVEKCEHLIAAINSKDIEAIVHSYALFSRVVSDVLPWQGDILSLADELKAAISKIKKLHSRK